MGNKLYPYESKIDTKTRTEMVGEMLRYLRKKHKYSQSYVANQIQQKQQTYCNYENAISEPSIETLVRLSYLYDVSLDLLTQRDVLVYSKSGVKEEMKKVECEIKSLKAELNNREVTRENDMLLKTLNQLAQLANLIKKEAGKPEETGEDNE